MGITDRNTLKGWFLRGMKPLSTQFAAWIDSYWHKDDKIPVTSIDGLQQEFNKYVVKEDIAIIQTEIDNLQQQVDFINNRIDILELSKTTVAAVQSYGDLEKFDTSTLNTGDTVGVLTDETEDDRYSVYTWSGEQWFYIGSTAAYVTMADYMKYIQDQEVKDQAQDNLIAELSVKSFYFSINEFSSDNSEDSIIDHGFYLVHEDMVGATIQSIGIRVFSKIGDADSVYSIHVMGIDGTDKVISTITMAADQLYYLSNSLVNIPYVIESGDVILVRVDDANPESKGLSVTFKAVL